MRPNLTSQDGPEALEEDVEGTPEEESPETRALFDTLTAVAKTRLLTPAETDDVRRIRAARERAHREATSSRRRASQAAHEFRVRNDPAYALRSATLPDGATRSASGVVSHNGHIVVPTTVGICARPAFLIIAPDESRRTVHDPAEALDAVDSADASAPLTAPARRPSRDFRALRSLRL